MSKSEKKKKGLVVIALAFIGVSAIAYFAISYQVQHNHRTPANAPQRQVVENVATEQGTAANVAKKGTPSLAAGAQLPSDIPPAMLKAMEERGMSIEELRGSGKGSSTMSSGKKSVNLNGSMGNKEVPSAMQKALADRDAANAQMSKGTPEGMRVQTPPSNTSFPPYIYQAIAHVENHKIEEQLALLTRNMDVLALNPNDVQVLVSTADLFLKHNEIQAAGYLLERATTAAPSNADVAHRYGMILAKNFESEKAAMQWERALRIQDTPRVRLDLALLYRYQLNQPELAKQNLEKALTLPDLSSSLRGEIKRELAR